MRRYVRPSGAVWRRVLVTVAGTAALLVGLQGSAFAASPAGHLAGGRLPFGISERAYTALWWQWALGAPIHDPPYTGPIVNPLFDPTGAACSTDQMGPVWFLAGQESPGTVTRSCLVPAGEYLFFPLINIEADNIGVVPPLTPQQWRPLVRQAVDATTELHLSIDGTALPEGELFRHRAASPIFSYTLPPEDNVAQSFGEDAKGFIFPVVSDGYWIMLKPLSIGDHVIEFGGTVGTFSLDVTYHLTVLPAPDARPGGIAGEIGHFRMA